MCLRAAIRPHRRDDRSAGTDRQQLHALRRQRGTTPVGVLTAWPPLSSASTNVDAAIAQVNSGAVSTTGAILELGLPGQAVCWPPRLRASLRRLARERTGPINMTVAKSGRTTGLTCASISAINATVEVSYFKDCAETEPYLTKTYTNQIEIAGNQFSDAGDSGSLVVDASDAEPVDCSLPAGSRIRARARALPIPCPRCWPSSTRCRREPPTRLSAPRTTRLAASTTATPQRLRLKEPRSPMRRPRLPSRRSRRRAC